MKKETIIFWILIVIGIISRIFMWPYGLEEVNCDEAMTAINAKAIADYGTDMYGTSFPVYFEAWQYGGQSALLCYLIAITIKIIGMSHLAVRLPMMIMSIITLFVMYDLVKRILKNKKIALIALALLAICPWHIMQSKWGLDCNMFPHITLIGVYLLYRGLEKKRYIYISMVFFGLAMYAYGVALYFMPIFLIGTAIYLIKNKKITIKELMYCIAIYLIISFPIYLMTIINLLKLPDVQIGGITIQYFDGVKRTEDMLIFSDSILKDFTKNISSLLELLILQQDDCIWNRIPGFGTIYLFTNLFFVLGICLYFKERNNKEKESIIGMPIILIWFLAGLMIGILNSEANINRLNIIWYPMIIISSYGIYELIKRLKYKKVVSVIIISAYTISFLLFNYIYYEKHTEEINNNHYWSKGMLKSIEYAECLGTNQIIINDTSIGQDEGLHVYVKYVLELDYHYYTLGEDTYKNGKKLVPFEERYKVIKEKKLDLDKDIENGKVYIIKTDIIEDKSKLNNYNYKQFRKFIVITGYKD